MLDYVGVSSGFLIAIARGVSVLWGVGLERPWGWGGTTDEYLAPAAGGTIPYASSLSGRFPKL